MAVFLDLDEVLADFTKGALQVHNRTNQDLNQSRELGTWSIVEPMGLTLDEFWEPIHVAGKEFWSGLQPLPWMEEMLQCVWYYEVHIVSSPSECPTSYMGKMEWIKHHLNYFLARDCYRGHIFLNNNKEVFAHLPDALLIDDREENISRFVQRGGDAILFPSMGNCLHKQADNPVDYIKTQLAIRIPRR